MATTVYLKKTNTHNNTTSTVSAQIAIELKLKKKTH